MFVYYIRLALNNILRHKLLTALTVLVIAIGVSVCMTALTVLQILSSDPIPQKSENLYHPQLDAEDMAQYVPNRNPQKQLSRYDAEALFKAKRADRQAIMNSGIVAVDSGNPGANPFYQESRYTTADFFGLFDTPFRYGSGWSKEDDERAALIAVISKDLNDRVFSGRNSVGKKVLLNDREFTIAGVLDVWRPMPQFYDMGVRDLGYQDHVFIPFYTALNLNLPRTGTINCWGKNTDDPVALNSTCAWTQFWVELDSPKKVEAYKAFLDNYSAQQRASGRYLRPVNTRLRNVNEWLEYNEVVPRDVELQLWLAIGFMIVCLINAIGLLLAKFLRRSAEIGIRQAMGASRSDIFKQHLVESAILGLAGVVPGIALSAFGLWVVQRLPGDYAKVAELNLFTLYGIVALAIFASLLAGALPAWRACQTSPAIQMRA